MVSYAAPNKSPPKSFCSFCGEVQSRSGEWPKPGSEKKGNSPKRSLDRMYSLAKRSIYILVVVLFIFFLVALYRFPFLATPPLLIYVAQ